MRLTLEKVLILKDVPLFAGIPEATLSDIIAASEEITVMIGTDLIREGEAWNDMYIILQGQIRFHKNGTTVREYNALDVFGELTALDPAPADVTVTALEDTTLFKISGPALYRLMNEHKALGKILSNRCAGASNRCARKRLKRKQIPINYLPKEPTADLLISEPPDPLREIIKSVILTPIYPSSVTIISPLAIGISFARISTGSFNSWLSSTTAPRPNFNNW